jgi:hypothetical protein
MTGRGGNRGIGIDWTFSNHIGHINNRGETIIHEVGLRCTCGREDTFLGYTEDGAHVPRRRQSLNCAICGGEGYIYRQSRRLVGLVTNISQRKQQMEAGWVQPGDCMLSVKPGITISGGDKIIQTWPQVIPEGQVIQRGAAALNTNALLETNVSEDEDLLWYNAEESIYCEDEDGNTYSSRGGDFILDTSKLIRWVGNQPQKGKLYTIKYTGYLEWLAFFPPDIRRDRDRDLGMRTALRKRHIVRLNADPTITTDDRVPFCSRLGCPIA